jgi:prepilin signal peptidase PulO-like enzyme (type II secretory pathway)
VNLVTMFANLGGSLPPVLRMVFGFAYVLGGYYVFVALRRLWKMGNGDPHIHTESIAMGFAIAGCLIAAPTAVGADLGTFFATTHPSALQYSGPGGPEMTTAAKAIVLFIQIVGVIAVIRGFMILRAVAHGNSRDTTAKGMTHILGGAFAANVVGAALLMGNTVGIHLPI